MNVNNHIALLKGFAYSLFFVSVSCFAMQPEKTPAQIATNVLISICKKRDGDIKMARMFIDRGAFLGKDSTGKTPLSYARDAGNDQIEHLLSQELYKKMLAVVKDSSSLSHDVNFLLECGFDINRKNVAGCTVLHLATLLGKTKFVEHILPLGANPDIPTNEGTAPIHIATQQGHVAVVKALLNNKVNVHAKTPFGLTGMHYASLNGYSDVVKCLYEHDSTALEIIDEKDGNSVLYHACQSGNVPTVKFIIDAGADVNLANVHGVTCLHIAGQHCYKEIAQLLINAGANLDKVASQYEMTPLTLVSMNGSISMVELFLQGVGNYTPLLRDLYQAKALAEAGKHKKIIALLMPIIKAHEDAIEAQKLIEAAQVEKGSPKKEKPAVVITPAKKKKRKKTQAKKSLFKQSQSHEASIEEEDEDAHNGESQRYVINCEPISANHLSVSSSDISLSLSVGELSFSLSASEVLVEDMQPVGFIDVRSEDAKHRNLIVLFPNKTVEPCVHYKNVSNQIVKTDLLTSVKPQLSMGYNFLAGLRFNDHVLQKYNNKLDNNHAFSTDVEEKFGHFARAVISLESNGIYLMECRIAGQLRSSESDMETAFEQPASGDFCYLVELPYFSSKNWSKDARIIHRFFEPYARS